jgi:hypothetical protein
VEVGLASAGIRHRPLPWLLLCLGVALAVGFPVFAGGLREESGAAAVTGALNGLPADQRTVLANTYRNLSGEPADRLDNTVRTGLSEAGVTSVAGALVFKPISIASTVVSLAALDKIDSRVRLTSGRLPSVCTPDRCEVVSVQLPGVATTFDGAARAERELGIVVTGTAELTDHRLVGVGLIGADRPLLLGGAPDQLAELASLQLFGRTLSWFGTLDGPTIAATGVDRYAAALSAISDEVNLAVDGPLSVSWPAAAVAAAEARAVASADRFAVLGAGAGALQLGLCLVVAAWLRRRQQLVGVLLARRGGSSAQITAVTLLQAVPAVVLGVLVGAGVAAFVVALRGSSAGVASGSATEAGLTAAVSALGSTAPVLIALAVLAVAGVTAVARWPATGAGAARYLTGFALAVSLLLPFLVLSGEIGGPSRSSALSPGSVPNPGPLPTLAVVAAVVAAGLLTALVWPRLIAVGRSPRTMTAASSTRVIAQRRPLLPMITAGFLAASCCLLVFTAGYRQSLHQSGEDQAAYRVPLDVSMAASARTAAPLDSLDGDRLREVAPGTVVRPVVTSPVTAFGGTTRALVLPLTAVDPDTLIEMHEFGSVTGASVTADELAQQLGSGQPLGPAAPIIPAGARRIALSAQGFNADITLGLWLSTVDGRQQQVRLEGSGPELTAELPGGAARIVQGLEIAESEIRLTRREHASGEGEVDREVTAGRLTLSPPRIDGQPADWDWSGWGSGQAEVGTQPAKADVAYRFEDARIVLTPGFVAPESRSPLAVAVDPDTAARAGESGRLVLTLNSQSVPAQIVAVLPRFPVGSQHFLVADRATVLSLLNQVAPGTAFVSQVWIGVPDEGLATVREALESSPASATTLTFRADLARAIIGDPVATRSILLLTVAGAVALGLAMVAAGTAVRADLEESQVDQQALEHDGVAPAGLRSRLFRRGLLVAAVGVPIGLAGGLLLTVLGVRLLLTGPGGEAVLPPLRPVLGGLPVLLVVGTAAVGVLAASLVAAATAFREAWAPVTDLDLP